jgi:hypothetical protein
MDPPKRGVCDTEALGRLKAPLTLLRQAREYALGLGRSLWEFAVEVSDLRGLGLTNTDLRWLLCRGLIEHASETTLPGQDSRTFQADGRLTITDKTCVVLTEAGLLASLGEEPVTEDGPVGQRASSGPLPRWDGTRRALFLGNTVVKVFRQPAACQEMILAAFEEEGWPWRVDDPLPPLGERDPKQRLHHTIKNLNRNRAVRLINFHGDGTGCGVGWSLCR